MKTLNPLISRNGVVRRVVTAEKVNPESPHWGTTCMRVLQIFINFFQVDYKWTDTVVEEKRHGRNFISSYFRPIRSLFMHFEFIDTTEISTSKSGLICVLRHNQFQAFLRIFNNCNVNRVISEPSRLIFSSRNIPSVDVFFLFGSR